jgi:hypothetical protein
MSRRRVFFYKEEEELIISLSNIDSPPRQICSFNQYPGYFDSNKYLSCVSFVPEILHKSIPIPIDTPVHYTSK